MFGRCPALALETIHGVNPGVVIPSEVDSHLRDTETEKDVRDEVGPDEEGVLRHAQSQYVVSQVALCQASNGF